MIRHGFFAIAATAAMAVLTSAPSAQAATSTQGFTAQSTTEVSGVSSDKYTLTDFTSTAGQTGGFLTPTAYPVTNLGTITFDVSSATGDLSFNNASFGSFTSTSVVENYRGTGGAIYTFQGTWAPGSISSQPMAGMASIVVSISYNGGTLSSSATLAVGEVPEPSSIVLGLAGLAIGGLAHGLRRRRAGK